MPKVHHHHHQDNISRFNQICQACYLWWRRHTKHQRNWKLTQLPPSLSLPQSYLISRMFLPVLMISLQVSTSPFWSIKTVQGNQQPLWAPQSLVWFIFIFVFGRTHCSSRGWRRIGTTSSVNWFTWRDVMELQHACFARQGPLSSIVMTSSGSIYIAKCALCPDMQVNPFI